MQIVVSEVRPRGLASKWWQFAAGDKGDKGDTVVAQAWYQLPLFPSLLATLYHHPLRC